MGADVEMAIPTTPEKVFPGFTLWGHAPPFMRTLVGPAG